MHHGQQQLANCISIADVDCFFFFLGGEVQDGRADEVSIASVQAHAEAGAEMLPEDVSMFLGNLEGLAVF